MTTGPATTIERQRVGERLMLGDEYMVVAVILRLAAGVGYLVATWRRIVQPNPVSWLLWGLTPLTAFVALVQDGVTPQAWVVLTLGVSPLLVFAVSVTRKTRWRVSRCDALCGGSAATGIVLWQITSNPGLALLFSIVADILASIPTLTKACEAPRSERSLPYLVSMASMVVILSTMSDPQLVDYAFPLYMLSINTAIFSVVRLRTAQLDRRLPYQVAPPSPQRGSVAAPAEPASGGGGAAPLLWIVDGRPACRSSYTSVSNSSPRKGLAIPGTVFRADRDPQVSAARSLRDLPVASKPWDACGCPKRPSSHAAYRYSWMSPPSRSRRITGTVGSGGGSTASSKGGWCCSDWYGRSALQ